jgi:hypothetical protein
LRGQSGLNFRRKNNFEIKLLEQFRPATHGLEIASTARGPKVDPSENY